MPAHSVVYITLLTIAVVTVYTQAQYRRVCYYTNWAQYRPGTGKYTPENMDPTLCTHIIYAFAKLNGNRLVAFEWNDESTEWMKGMYAKYNDHKIKNPGVKTLLAVGGWNMGSKPFTAMVATAASRREFATSTVAFLRERNFDGVDLDWEYPANRGSPPQDKHRYTQLVREVRRAFDAEVRKPGQAPLLLTSAVAAGKSKIDTAYDIPQTCRDMDFINLMAYDLHGSWENVTGHNSPLYPHPIEKGDQVLLNMDWASNYWVQKGCPKDKLVIGMGLYGRSFTLRDRTNNGLMAPVKGKGEAGKYTREGGFLSYYEICDMLKKGAQSYYIKEQQVPYVVFNDQWVGYDDVDSLRIKVKWMKQNGFSGVMVWALDLDDFSGGCGQGKYPLLRAINDELRGRGGRPNPRKQNRIGQTNRRLPNRQQPRQQLPRSRPQPRPQPQPQPPRTRTQQPRTQQPRTQQPRQQPRPQPRTPPVRKAWNKHIPATIAPVTRTPKPNLPHLSKDFKCPTNANDYYSSPRHCQEYYICAQGLSFKFTCSPPLLWNKVSNFCDWPGNVKCGPTKPTPRRRPVTRRPTTPRPTTTTSRPTTTPVTPPPWMNWSLWIAEFWKALASMQASPGTWRQQNSANSIVPPIQKAFCTGRLDGIHADPTDCTKYIDCVKGQEYRSSCPTLTAFDTKSGVCNHKEKVQRCFVTG